MTLDLDVEVSPDHVLVIPRELGHRCACPLAWPPDDGCVRLAAADTCTCDPAPCLTGLAVDGAALGGTSAGAAAFFVDPLHGGSAPASLSVAACTGDVSYPLPADALVAPRIVEVAEGGRVRLADFAGLEVVTATSDGLVCRRPATAVEVVPAFGSLHVVALAEERARATGRVRVWRGAPSFGSVAALTVGEDGRWEVPSVTSVQVRLGADVVLAQVTAASFDAGGGGLRLAVVVDDPEVAAVEVALLPGGDVVRLIDHAGRGAEATTPHDDGRLRLELGRAAGGVLAFAPGPLGFDGVEVDVALQWVTPALVAP